MVPPNLAHKEEFQVTEELQEEETDIQVTHRPHKIYKNNMIIGSEKPQAY